MIDQLRHTTPATGRPSRPSAERATNDSLRQQLDALQGPDTPSCKPENRQLREALARKLRQQRTDRSADW